jgi:hypothetical protein
MQTSFLVFLIASKFKFAVGRFYQVDWLAALSVVLAKNDAETSNLIKGICSR